MGRYIEEFIKKHFNKSSRDLYVFVDLHTHSPYSDGIKPLTSLLSMAKELGLTAYAVADHDTLQGAEELLLLKQLAGNLTLISGVEITTYTLDGEERHILGYGIDISKAAELERLLQSHLDERRRYVSEALEMYRRAGIMDVTYEELARYFDYPGPVLSTLQLLQYRVEQFGLPHDEVQGELILPGGVVHAHRNKTAFIDTFDAIELIRDLGGVPVWAHPGGNFGKIDPRSVSEKMAAIEELVIEMKRCGLLGIEAAHPRHDPVLIGCLRELAAKEKLIATAGSDWHGFNFNNRQFGSLCMKKSDLELLLAYAA